jgi:hypothetical protein
MNRHPGGTESAVRRFAKERNSRNPLEILPLENNLFNCQLIIVNCQLLILRPYILYCFSINEKNKIKAKVY